MAKVGNMRNRAVLCRICTKYSLFDPTEPKQMPSEQQQQPSETIHCSFPVVSVKKKIRLATCSGHFVELVKK